MEKLDRCFARILKKFPIMRRLFSRKSSEDAKDGKGDGNEVKKKKTLFTVRSKKEHIQPELAKPPQQQSINLTIVTNDSNTPSSASSAVSIPPSAPYLPTPSGSSSSFSSVASCSEASPCTELVVPSTTPPSTLSKSLGLNTSTTSLNSINGASKSGAVPSLSQSPAPRPQSSHTEPKKPLSPLSVVVNLHSVHTPPPSDDEEEDFIPKRRNSIYNIFKKSHSQPNLNSNPPSRSSSTTTLPSTFNAPHASSANIAPSPAPQNHRKSVNFLRRKSSAHSLQEDEDVTDLDGILSRNEATARRAILQGDPLGGGAYSYPMGLAHRSDSIHRPSPPPSGHRTRRGATGRSYDPRTSSWIGTGSYGNGGMAWRAPHIGGRNCARMTIEEENDMMEQQQYQLERQAAVGEFIEDAPQFERPQPQRFKPTSTRRPQSWRANSPGYGYYHTNDQRSNYYPPFAPQQTLPVINQHSSQA